MSLQSYPYLEEAPGSRQIGTHGTCSADSSSASPDEDWTKISDFAERRRVQNRIAQRRYRKKLKTRLEDLERRTGPSSASPPQIGLTSRVSESRRHYKKSPEIQHPQTSPRLRPSQFTPPMQSDDDGIFTNNFQQDESRTPPLIMSPAYAQPYGSIWSSDDGTRADTDYLLNIAYQGLPTVEIQRYHGYNGSNHQLWSMLEEV